MTERPGWVLLGVLAFTLFSIAGLVDLRTGAPRLGLDPSATGMLPSGGAERELYEKARRLFGSDEPIIIGVGAPDVFTPDVLERVAAMTRAIEGIDGVQNVLSLATAPNVRSVDGDIEVAPFLETIPREPGDLDRLRREALANPIYAGTLVSRDARATALLVSLDRMTDQELIQRRLDARVVSAARGSAGDLELWVSGVPHVKTFLTDSLLHELSYMLPLILLLLALVLYLQSRSLRGVLVPIATIVLSLVWTLGTLGWLGQELNIVTIMVPALILTLGFTYALHVLSEYEAELVAHESVEPREAAQRTLESVWVAVVVTCVTTVAGFVSLALNPIVAIREFGLFAALGDVFTVLATLTFVPALLSVLPRPRRFHQVKDGWLEEMAARLGSFGMGHRRLLIGGACVFLAVCIVGMSRIRVAAEIPDLRADNPVRRDYEAINARFGGANQLRILLETDVPDAFLEPANLGQVQALQEWLESQPEVGETISIADYVALLHRAMGDDAGRDPSALPETKRLVSQLLLFGASPETKRFADARYQTANVLVFAKVGNSDALADVVARIDRRLEELPQHLRASVTGSAVLLGRVVDDVSWGQFTSLTSAFLQIYLVLVLMFMSFRVGLLALLPNAVPIFAYFGVLGFTGITLNPMTSLVGSLALGVVVDDTIHFFHRFNLEARRLADERKAAGAALRALIRPVTFTTVGLCAGFLVLTLSEQRAEAQFGLLASLIFGFGWLCDAVLSPALCSGVRIVTLWDVLRLDLGREPQKEIDLFRDLSLRQARIFALMSEIRRLPAGGRLLSEGETGADMFVILQGELVAFVERDGKRRDLSTMTRGHVVGEVGSFGVKRTASVDAVSDALLIRFDADDLERLRRRYPPIAAIAYRNLNRIQAERLARTTLKVQGAG